MAYLSKGETLGVISIVGLVAVLITALLIIERRPTRIERRPTRPDLLADLKKASAPTRVLPAIEYAVLRSHAVSNVVDTRWILIDPKYVNRSDLLILGEQLMRETSAARNAGVYIYDSKRAFDLRWAAENGYVSDADGKYFDRHFVGAYARNASTRYHIFNAWIGGLDGVPLSVKYDFSCCQ